MSIACTRMGGVAALPAEVAAPETSSDGMLIRRIAQGDQLAMRTLFGRHRVPVYRWLLRLVGDEALAEDLLSDVFLDVWRQAASFEARASVSTWLLAIARYKALSARRRRTDAALDEKVASKVADHARMPTARHGLGAAVVAGRIYVISGGPTPGASASAANEIFLP
jgi:Sigma-70 region 2